MKKIISLMLIIAMIMTSFTSIYASSYSEDQLKIIQNYQTIVNYLNLEPIDSNIIISSILNGMYMEDRNEDITIVVSKSGFGATVLKNGISKTYTGNKENGVKNVYTYNVNDVKSVNMLEPRVEPGPSESLYSYKKLFSYSMNRYVDRIAVSLQVPDKSRPGYSTTTTKFSYGSLTSEPWYRAVNNFINYMGAAQRCISDAEKYADTAINAQVESSLTAAEKKKYGTEVTNSLFKSYEIYSAVKENEGFLSMVGAYVKSAITSAINSTITMRIVNTVFASSMWVMYRLNLSYLHDFYNTFKSY